MADKLSPMMRHYIQVKEEYSDCIVFYRLGDFYEMFFEDAVVVSRELELTLTGRDCGMEERAPMCGVPFHSADTYISKLINLGYKVAICEQIGDPKLSTGSTVERQVIRVLTPGTVVDEGILDDGNSNYLVVMYRDMQGIGFTVSDASTGEIRTTQLADERFIIDELAGYSPKEIIVNNMFSKALAERIERSIGVKCEYRDELFSDNTTALVEKQFGNSLDELDLSTRPNAVKSTGATLNYIAYARKTDIEYINKINVYNIESYMEIDYATRRNLEITETMRDKAKKGTIYWILDKTQTAMGRRKLKQWIEHPLLNSIEINRRLQSVKELVDNAILRDDIMEILSSTYDISRIISRIALKTVSPKDLVSLKQTLKQLPSLEYKLSGMKSPMFAAMAKNFDILDDVYRLIDESINEEKATSHLRDGDYIKDGYNSEVDMLRSARKNGKQWIKDLEEEEKERTGIPKLKTGYNRVFGYYIEVTNAYKDRVPEDYIRKQTLANAERYITPRLKEIESSILGASERLEALESELFNKIREIVAVEIERMKKAAEVIAVTDVLCSLATVAYKNNYVMPEITNDGIIDIKEGRHPVVEKINKDIIFVPNDTYINMDDYRLLIITGPNMAGKSTYMRQTAVITLMAQIGSFVPAQSAKIGIVDRIFTRVGASDDIASGQSTFMLEMTEVSNILKNATKNSLIIMDEIGRGTSTYDGLSIAWAVAEYIHDKKNVGAKTMFATHYHEMTELEDRLEGVKNFHVAVNKKGDDISFLRRIVRGGADESYGIEVAALAGVPKNVIKRAKEILKNISEGEEISLRKPKVKEEEITDQIGFEDIAGREILRELKDMDVTTLTAIDAMNKLYQLSLKAKEI